MAAVLNTVSRQTSCALWTPCAAPFSAENLMRRKNKSLETKCRGQFARQPSGQACGGVGRRFGAVWGGQTTIYCTGPPSLLALCEAAAARQGQDVCWRSRRARRVLARLRRKGSENPRRRLEEPSQAVGHVRARASVPGKPALPRNAAHESFWALAGRHSGTGSWAAPRGTTHQR